MCTHDARCEVGRHSDGLGSGKRVIRLKLDTHFSECGRLLLGRRDLRDGTQASFGQKVCLVIRQIHQSVQNFWRELQQLELLGDSCSGHAQMSCQVCLGGTSALFEKVLENERLSCRIGCGLGWFIAGQSWCDLCGFNTRYEEIAVVQSRTVNPEGQIKRVRKSFGRGEPVIILQRNRRFGERRGFQICDL